MSVTATLCEKIVATTYDQLTPEAVTAARRLVLDGLSVALAGTHEQAIRILADHFRSFGGSPDATAIGFGFKLPTVFAAALNGAAMHVLDFEPMWSPATHAVSVTLPAILALAEQRRMGGRDVIAALVKAVEIQGLIRAASHQDEHGTTQFHPPGLVGPMGSAVGAGHMLGLDAGQLANALGIASSRCGSVLGNVGTMTKSTHCGQAGALGLDAALLASRGFTANPESFDAPRAYADVFFHGTFKPEEMLAFGPPFRLVDPGYVVKMFPSQFATQFAITAGLELHPQIGDPARIRAVTLTAPSMPYIDRPTPETGLSGKFSLQYTLSSALLRGKVQISTFTDTAVQDPEIRALLAKVKLATDKTIPARFDRMHVEATVEMDDGRVLRARCNGPRGHWGTPPLGADEHLVKVRDCLATAGLSTDEAEHVIAAASKVETLDAAGIAALIAVVGKTRAVH